MADAKVAAEFWSSITEGERLEILHFSDKALVERASALRQNLRQREAGQDTHTTGGSACMEWLKFDTGSHREQVSAAGSQHVCVTSMFVSCDFGARADLPAVLSAHLGSSLLGGRAPVRSEDLASVFNPEPKSWEELKQQAFRLLGLAVLHAERDARSAAGDEDEGALTMDEGATSIRNSKKRAKKKKTKTERAAAGLEEEHSGPEAEPAVPAPVVPPRAPQQEEPEERAVLECRAGRPETETAAQATDASSSLGSLPHGSFTPEGQPECQPCAWFYKPSGCLNGSACRYCHLCPAGELKNRKKQKIALLRKLDGRQVGGALEASTSDESPVSVPVEDPKLASKALLPSGALAQCERLSWNSTETGSRSGLSTGSGATSPRDDEENHLSKLQEVAGMRAVVKWTFLHFESEAAVTTQRRLRSLSCNC